ncbi:MAG: hypothetical protein JWM95_3240 [Gemmatimonadetes bacterium]|nr:hypothetical protein [Gemmatimonadota bacterium]
MFIKRFGATALLVFSAACASSTSSATPGTASATPSNPDVITAADIAADPSIAAGDAYQAVQKLRPRFLMTRGQMSGKNVTAGSVKLSIDGGALVTIDNLSRYAASSIVELRYLNANDAAQRFGMAAGSGGVVMLKSK